MKKWVTKSSIWVLLVAIIVLFAGCNNNDNQQNADPNANPTNENSTPVTLKVGMVGTDIKTACIIIAEELGYYDEEGIREEQIETAHYCRQCSGYLTIRTAAAGTRFGDQSAFIVSLKRDTCSECRQTAYDEAQLEKRNGKWQYVLVQHIADGEIESL